MAPATVSWINAAGGQWDQGANWSTGSVPGASDDVVINTASTASISIVSGDTEAVHSLTTAANDTLSITGGSLTIGGNSTLSGPLSMTAGTLTASGSGITVTVNGTTNVAAANVLAENGATLALPNLTSYTGLVGNETYLAASGAGSTLSLANLTSVSPSTSFASMTAIEALSGASVDVSGLAQVSGGAVTFESDGAGSQLNASALTSIDHTAGNFDSVVQVTNHGTLLDPKLATLDGTDLTLDGTGTLSTNQITHLVSGTLKLTGGSVTLTGLSDFDTSSAIVSGGAALSLPAVTSYTSVLDGETILGATGAGSSLSLANLTNLTPSTNFVGLTAIEALAGASVNVAALPHITGGAVTLESDGAGSQLNASALTSMAQTVGNVASVLQVTNHGTLVDPHLATLDRITLDLDGTGTVGTNQITQLTHSILNDSNATLSFTGLTNIAGSTFTVTNTGVLNLPAGSAFSGQGASLDVSGGGTINLGSTVLQVPAAGSGVTINVPQLPSGATLFMPNSGTFSNLVLNVTAGDSVTITGGTYAGGTFNVGAGADVDLTGGSILTYSGTFSGSGAGTVQLNTGTLVIGMGGLTLDFTGTGSFVWGGGFITSALGDLTNRGNMSLIGTGDRQFENDGTLDNFANIVQNANLGLHSDNVTPTTLKNEPGATYTIQNDTGFDNPFGGQTAVINEGTIRKTGGTGTSSLLVNGVLNNTGTIEADTGTVALQTGSVTQISGSTLTAGTWSAVGGAALRLPPGTAITINDANLILSGAGSAIAGISGLATNNGTFTIANGATFTTAAALSNAGTITLGPAGTLNVKGAYSQSSAATLAEQIGGTPASGQFGQLTVNGAATLAGNFALALVNGFTPAAGQAFQVMTFGSVSGNFATYTGLGANITSALNPTSLVLTVHAGTVKVVPTSVTAPATATAGQTITVGWQVQNQGQAATGNWVDSVYLSTSPTINSSSILLGTAEHTGGLAANATYTGSLSAALPATAVGNYYVLVQVDSHFQLPEANRASTTLAASGQLAISVPALTLGTPRSDSFTAADQDRYYQITVPVGGSLQFSLTSAASSGALALYVSSGSLPTPYSFQEEANVANQPNQTLTVPQVSAGGTYYVLVHSVAGAAATSPFTLTATQTNALTVSAPAAAYSGGNGGNLTIAIPGTNFSRSTTARITLGGLTINAASVYYVNASQIYATFNLKGAPLGNYTLQVVDGAQVVTSPAKVAVVPAGPDSQPQAAGVMISADTVAIGVNEDPLALGITPPSLVSAGRDSLVYVSATNTTNNDMLAPLLNVTADGATLKLETQSEFQGSSLWFLGTSSTGPAGILRPGESVELAIQFQSTTVNPSIDFQLNVSNDTAAMNWAAQEQALQIPTIPNAAWPIVFSNFVANMGSTVGSYHAVLAADATYLGQFGETNNDVLQLAEFEIEKANAAYTTQTLDTVTAADLPAPGFDLQFQQSYLASISGRYYQGILGQGWVTNWDISALKTTSGDVAIRTNGTSIYFFLQPDGSYLPEPGDEGETLTLSSGAYRLQHSDGSVYQFNPNGTLAYEQDANGNRVTATYNAGGELAQLTDSNGEFFKLTYNSHGQLVTLQDSNGQTATYGYTGSFLTSYTDSYGTTVYTYASGGTAAQNGSLTEIAYADNTHLFFSYDAQGRLIDQHRDGGGEDEKFSYLTPGGVTTTDADGHPTTDLYDLYGATAEAIDGLGDVTLYRYDANLNLVQIVGPQGFTESYTYDANGNLTSETDPLGNISRFSYNANNDLTGFTDAKGNTTTYAYNGQNDLLSITYANGTSVQATYNPLGEAIQFVNGRQQPTGYTYNADGLVTAESFQDGTSYAFTYSAQGEVTSATDAQGHVTHFLYGNAANPTLLTEVDYPDGTFLKFKYNVVGQRTQSVDQTGFTINYAYDALGRASTLTDGSGNLIVRYTYDAAGNLQQKDMGNGTRTVYTYDADNRVVSITNYAPDHATVNSFDTYAYDPLGNVVTDTNQDGQWAYSYDAANQLTNAVFTPNSKDPDGLTAQSLQYVYDAAGNRVSETVNGVVTTYLVNNVNEYTSSTTAGVGTTTYQYDADGNRISATDGSGTTAYTYDILNQLTGVNGPGQSASYAYDPLGNLVSESLNGATTNYQVDPTGMSTIVAAFSGSGVYDNSGGLIAHYTYGIGLTSQVSAAGSASYYDFGLIGNTVGLTGSAGAYVNQYAYQPFGATTTLKATIANPFTFVGQDGVLDDGAGLTSMRARTYDPVTGQFMSNDPLGLWGGSLNIRSYVANSPVDGVDPSGFCTPKPNRNPPPNRKFLGAWKPWFFGTLGPLEMHYEGGPLDATTFPVTSQDACYYYYDGAAEGIDGFYQPIPGGAADPNAGKQAGDPGNSSGGSTGGNGGCACGCPPNSPPAAGTNPGPSGDADNHSAHDPNAIIGPAGYGAQGFILPGGPWSYTVDFENDGTAPALGVTVTQQLDPNLDWSTFQLGSFGFGSQNIVIPPGLTEYETTVPYRNSDGTALNVQVAINFNVQTGVLSVTYTSLDPSTGQAPAGVNDGFLPPDNATHIGEGFVQYTVQPKPGLKTGAVVNQQASIVFDINPAIPTATAVNTIDVGAPTSSVQPLPATTTGSSIPVSWSGSDDAGGSGIATYDVYVSVNGGPFTPWLTGTTQTSASYTGVVGDTYSFYSVATDNVGNRQATPTAAQATTKLLPGSGTLVAIPVSGSDELFAVSADHGLYFYRSAVGWQKIGGAGTIQSISGVADSSGNAVLFVVTTDGALDRYSSATGWSQIGGSGTIDSISAGTDAAGQADVFVLTAGNAFFQYSQAGWAQIGAANTILSMNAADHGRVVVVTADHSVFEFGPSTGWIRLTSAGFAQSLSVSTQANGNLVVFAITENNGLFEEDLTTGWHPLGAAGTIQSISTGTDAHGNADVFALTADDSFYRYNTAGWALLGAPHTVVGMEAADSDRVFTVTADGSLFANDDSFGWYRLTGSGFAV